MTLEELLDCSVEKLEAMSDKELEEYFRPFFNVTRPEMQEKKSSRIPEDIETKLKIAKAKLLAKQFGIDLKGL